MDWLLKMVTNEFLITGLSSWFFAQMLKLVIHSILNKKVVMERLVGDGGMPSGHSATVTSLATISGLTFGFDSFQFAIAMLLAIIVCHDAMGVRLETDKQAKMINELTRLIKTLTDDSLPEVKLKEFVGHTPIQVHAGILIGVLNGCAMYFWVVPLLPTF